LKGLLARVSEELHRRDPQFPASPPSNASST
jgi:hypothetical protein